MLLQLLAASLLVVSAGANSMPLPFTRELKLTMPMMTGNDVLISCTLLKRDSAVSQSILCDSTFNEEDQSAVSSFQTANNLPQTGVLDSTTANLLLQLHSADGYKDSGFTARSMGYMYKFHVPVNSNRSIETRATLYDADNNVLMTFPVRSHGHRNDGSSEEWPDFGNGDVGLNEFTSNGNTVTGLVEIDLNSPEPDPALYGPWPVNRVVRGLDGNALLMLPSIRDGILIHTGNWTTDEISWNPAMTMPNSAGCMHSHPSDVERISQILVKLGVAINPNPFSGKNYPYTPQGVGVIELID